MQEIILQSMLGILAGAAVGIGVLAVDLLMQSTEPRRICKCGSKRFVRVRGFWRCAWCGTKFLPIIDE
jgi:hypothetical protein